MKLKKKKKTDYKHHEKLAAIRVKNVERHAGYENSKMLRENIMRFQRNSTYDMELQRLRGATVQGPLAAHAHKRIVDLKKMLGT